MQYIKHDTGAIYTGNRIHHRDIPVNPEHPCPGPHHKPVIEGGQHTGWELDTGAAIEEARNSRATAYAAEADPLFFKWQRGEATEQEWLDKVEEIRERYPYPDEE